MPGPEQRKEAEKAKRREALETLRGIYKKREIEKNKSSSPETSANANKDNTSTAAGFRVPAPVLLTTAHAMKANKEGRMLIHKDPSNLASLKRKAEDSGDAYEFEKEDKPKQGHETKKAKPTSGYVPGTGKPYRGTGKDMPNPRSSVYARALGNKSTNATLKSRDKIRKQDTKNLNRNIRKTKVLYDGTSRPTQSRPTQDSPKVAEQKAMEVAVTGPLQQTKRHTSNAAEPETMEDVKHGSLQASKRKNDCILENKTAKKPKMGASTTSPVRGLQSKTNTVSQARTTSFFARNQKPGHTAAMPSNAKHVQEMVKEPIPAPPKTLGKKEKSPIMKEVEAGASRKRKSREDGTETGTSKKIKFSSPSPTGCKAPSVEEVSEEPPKGLTNHFKACFANAGLQCLFGVPELLAHYEASKDKTLEEVQSIISGDTDLMRKGKLTRALRKKVEQLESAFARLKNDIFIGAYFGELARDLRAAAGSSSVSPFVFLQAYGAIFKDEDGSPMNGSSSQDSSEFINELLKRLHEEEMAKCEADDEKPILVQDLFNVQEGTKLACAKCGLVREHTADRYGLKVVLPTKDSSTLDELLKNTRTSNLMDDHVCPTCKTKDTTTEDVFVKKLPKYLIVQAPRARHVEDKNKHPVIKKIKTLIKFPTETLDLSPLLCGGQSSEDYIYEVFGTVEHMGNGHDDGHYVAARKILGRWYCMDDHNITLISDDLLPQFDQGQLFFLRRVE